MSQLIKYKPKNSRRHHHPVVDGRIMQRVVYLRIIVHCCQQPEPYVATKCSCGQTPEEEEEDEKDAKNANTMVLKNRATQVVVGLVIRTIK